MTARGKLTQLVSSALCFLSLKLSGSQCFYQLRATLLQHRKPMCHLRRVTGRQCPCYRAKPCGRQIVGSDINQDVDNVIA